MDTKMNLTLFLVASTLGILLNSSSALAQEEVVYFHTDAIGSVRAVTDNSGALVARWDYLPFGELWPTVPPHPAEVRQFAGKERDISTGLDYFGARYHRAVSGRFTSVDPVLNVEAALIDPQRWNRYTYAANRPFTTIDPDGRDPRLLTGGIGAAVFGTWQAASNVQLGRPWYENVHVEASKGFIVGLTLGIAAPVLATVGAPTAVAGATSAYDIAARGGRHSGFLKEYSGKTASQLQKAISSYEELIAKHIDKIQNPRKQIPGFDQLDPRRQDALIKTVWPGEVKNARQQLEILRRLLEGREPF